MKNKNSILEVRESVELINLLEFVLKSVNSDKVLNDFGVFGGFRIALTSAKDKLNKALSQLETDSSLSSDLTYKHSGSIEPNIESETKKGSSFLDRTVPSPAKKEGFVREIKDS